MTDRELFRELVFGRDQHKCVVCREPGQDAHHIMERRLFPDGGYDLNNGVTLCGKCHLQAESTELEPTMLRSFANITTTVLPPHLYPDEQYDKWGNVILPNGQRLRGELFEDESVQKILKPVLHLFTNRVKYPRTHHLPWSPGVTSDDRIISDDDIEEWYGKEVMVTEKMDGENTTMYRDYLHARSLDYSSHKSRDYIKALHARIAHNIPDGWRVCGENVWAKHSIEYTDLPGYFLIFSIWEGLRCLSWDETKIYAELLGLPTVPEITWGLFETGLKDFMSGWEGANLRHNSPSEGYVIRPRGEFRMVEFKSKVGKYVRKDHVQTHGHWMRSALIQNGLKNNA